MTDHDGYGSEYYVFKEGSIYKVGTLATVHPQKNETEAQFKDRLCRFLQLLEVMGMRDIKLEIQRRKGRITECVISFFQDPALEQFIDASAEALSQSAGSPVVLESLPITGGRFGERGRRGGSRQPVGARH
jgi:hypothetical protein